MANFALVNDYLTMIKSSVNDVDTVRYTPQQYIDVLNLGLAEGYRLRPDFYRGGESTITFLAVGGEAGPIVWPVQYALPLVLFASGMLELIDSEGNEDARAASLLSVFGTKLTKVGM